jgi:hypothetical protein
MGPLKITFSVVDSVQAFSHAVEAYRKVVDSVNKEHARLLRTYTMYFRVLEYCSDVIQHAHEGPLLETILEVAKQCAELGQHTVIRVHMMK